MRTQQEAERAEQQRIKKLVLNYDLRHEDDEYGNNANGDSTHSHYILQPNLNRHRDRRDSGFSQSKTSAETTGLRTGSVPQQSHERSSTQFARDFANAITGEKTTGQDGLSTTAAKQPPPAPGRGGSRRQQQTRKLQLSDVDWYGSKGA